MYIYIKIAFFMMCTGFSFLIMANTSFALSYQEKKDRDALAVMERAFSRTPMQPGLFDGNKILAGANSNQITLHLDRVMTLLKTTQSAWNNVSDKGRASQKAQQLMEKYNAYQSYATGLTKAFEQYSENQSNTAAEEKKNKKELQAVCKNFRKQVSKSDEHNMRSLAGIQDGQKFFLQDVEQLNRFRASASALAVTCSKPEFNNIQEACETLSYGRQTYEGKSCAAALNSKELFKKAVLNYAGFLAQQEGEDNVTIDLIKQQEGWIKLEGSVNWSTLAKGGKIPDVVAKRLKPLFAEVGLEASNQMIVMDSINQKSSKLTSIVKTLAPTWSMPGKNCNGTPCAVAVDTIKAWYPKSEILKNHQKQPNWKIRQHEVTKLPIERYRSGWTLIQVPNDPFCQLRSWTVYEKYAGGGQYQPGDNAHIGYVRWQKCS